MARLGQNPMRWSGEVSRPQRITVASIVFIPQLEGYWEESLQVLSRCVESLRDSTPEPFDLLIFDNGSCREARELLLRLRDRGAIQLLVLSERNLGKAGALNVLFGAAPGEIVVYTDSDVLFLPGWLESSLEILEAFPAAGMITAQPARRGLPRFCASTLGGAEADPEIVVRRGDLIPPRLIEATARGLGRTPEEHERIIAGQEDVLLARGGVEAYVSADHFQFLTTREVLRRLGRLETTRPISPADDQALDRRIDELGYWRLSTPGYLVHHQGNRLGPLPDLGAAVPDLPDAGASPAAAASRSRLGSRLRQSPRLRRLVKWLNVRTFRWLYPH